MTTLCYLSSGSRHTYLLVVYGKVDDPNYDGWAYVIQGSKGAPAEYWAFGEEPLEAFGLVGRFPQYYMCAIHGWGESASTILLIDPANNVNAYIVGKGNGEEEKATGNPDVWASWEVEDTCMISHPLSKRDDSYTDTGPLGLAVDLTSTIPVPTLEPEVSDNTHPPMPIVWILNSDCTLSAYRICNKFEALKGVSCQYMVSQIKDTPVITAATAILSPPPVAKPATTDAERSGIAGPASFGSTSKLDFNSTDPSGTFANAAKASQELWVWCEIVAKY